MKILFLSPRLPHRRRSSGHQIVYQRLVRLAARGHTIGLACFAPEDAPGGDDDELRHLLHEVHTVPLPPPPHGAAGVASALFPRVPEPYRLWASPAMHRLVGDLVERGRYEAVVAEFSYMGQFLRNNPFLPAVRTVISCHQSAIVARQKRIDLLGYSLPGLLARIGRGPLRRFEMKLYRAVDRVLTLTSHEMYLLQQIAPELAISAIPSAVDTQFFQPPVRAPRANGLVFTGNYADAPNRDAVKWFVTQVWPKVKQRHPMMMFYVVGPHPTREMQEFAFHDPSIVITGEVEDIRTYLGRAQVFVCPIRLGAGMWGKVLEAMAFGIPVVASSFAAEGIPVQDGETCFLGDTPDIMAQKINLLLDDPTLRAHMAGHAREIVVSRFSWDIHIRHLEQVLGDVLRERR